MGTSSNSPSSANHQGPNTIDLTQDQDVMLAVDAAVAGAALPGTPLVTEPQVHAKMTQMVGLMIGCAAEGGPAATRTTAGWATSWQQEERPPGQRDAWETERSSRSSSADGEGVGSGRKPQRLATSNELLPQASQNRKGGSSLGCFSDWRSSVDFTSLAAGVRERLVEGRRCSWTSLRTYGGRALSYSTLISSSMNP